MTDAVERGERIFEHIGSLDDIRSAGFARSTGNVSVTIDGERDDVPKHVKRVADRFDRTLIFRSTNADGTGGSESIFEIATDERIESIENYADKYDVENAYEVVDDSPSRAVADGGTEVEGDDPADCGRRTCDETADVTYTSKRGAIRTRCGVHALADGVDHVGESRAEDIVDAVDLDELVDRCEGISGAHSPPVLSRIDGLGPTSASKIAKAVDRSPVAKAVRRDDR